MLISRHGCVVLWAIFGLSMAQFIGEENKTALQPTAIIGGAERNLDQIGSTIVTDRTTTHLNCASGFMNIVVDFKEPFFGVIYPNGSRNSPCLSHGSGDTKYIIDLPLRGCNTKRVERRVFVNNIIVRFHKNLEFEGDEVKTIICRYPSPEVIPPPAPPVPIIAGPPPPIKNKVSGVEILMIICAIVFLALVLVGMACSYTCLKKRNIRIVRRRLPSGPPSEISKISSSIMFDGLKIPRAHASTTSESATVTPSETLPSDYPSESPSSGSEIEEALEVEEASISSVYSDAFVQSEAEVLAAHQVIKPPKPTFMVRVKKQPTPPRTPEPDYPVQVAQAQSLTTILERDESFHGESIPGSEHAMLVSETEDSDAPPVLHEQPQYAQVTRMTQDTSVPRPPPPPSEHESEARSVSEHELIIETHQPPRHIDMKHVENVTNIRQEFTDVDEVVELNKRRYLAMQAPSEPDSDYPSEARSVTDVVEDMTIIPRPKLTKHNVDDRYHTTITETHTTEDIERHRRFIKQYHMKPKPKPQWNVAIRHYPGPKYADELESSGPEWEGYSEPGSDVFRAAMLDGIDDRLSQVEVEALEHPPPPNWTVLLRVLDPPPTEEATREVLTEEDREKWRQIITTESNLRTMLSQATVREDFEMIRHDQRYERLFEPQKWDVIIRILSPLDAARQHTDDSSEAQSMSDTDSLPPKDGRRYKKHDPPSVGRKSNLAPLYEYDQDGNPIVKKTQGPPSSRSRRSSKSSLVSGMDVRSIPETEVNFARMDSWSEASGPSSHGARSHADRSHSEITYRAHVLGEDTDTDYDDRSSARTARSLARSASEFTEDWRHHERLERSSQSSADSKPHRQLERSTSEYCEEAPHLSDFPTSPDSSPQMRARYSHEYRLAPFEMADGSGAFVSQAHFSHEVRAAQESQPGAALVTREQRHSSQMMTTSHKTTSATHSHDTEWATKH